MELRDSAFSVLALAAVLLLLAMFTGSLIFYIAFAAAFIFIACDCMRLMLARSSLRRDLSLSAILSRTELPPGIAASYTLRAAYKSGWHGGVVLSLTPLLESPLAARQRPVDILLRNGEERTLNLEVLSERPGDYTVGQVRVSLSSLLYRETLVAGDAQTLRVRLPLGASMLRPSVFTRGDRKYARASGSVIERRRGSDFSGVREYLPGDNVKHIDWALSSRAGDLIVREYEAEKTLPTYYLIDLSMNAVGAKEQGIPVKAVSALINRQLIEGDKIGLIGFSRSGIEYEVKPGMGRGHVRHLSEVLSGLRAVSDTASGPGPAMSINELYDAGRAFARETGTDILKPILEETFKGYMANFRDDGFIRAIVTVARSSKYPSEIIVFTSLSMGLPTLMNGLRLARYYGHKVSVILYDSQSAGSAERAMELRSAADKLKAQSVRVMFGAGIDDSNGVLPESRINPDRSNLRG